MEERIVLNLSTQLGALVEELKKLNQNLEKKNAQKLQERSFSRGSFGGHGRNRDKKSLGGFYREDRYENKGDKRPFFDDRVNRDNCGGREKFFKKKRNF
jgi:hypothetical protein